MRIAALLTCHNRREKTMACLNSLFGIEPGIAVYLTDDGSADGTRAAVSSAYPQVHIIDGDGELYWNRGMLAAWREAEKGDYDYYLWLNDDVELYPEAIVELIACADDGRRVVSGLIADRENHEVIYGGYDANKLLVKANGEPQPIVWMNGNVVLVPRAVVQQIGLLDPYFQHDLGDVDYGMRAREAGIDVVSTRKVIAGGERNDVCRIRRWGTSLFGRFRYLRTPLGSPLGQNFYFRRRHFGFLHALAYDGHIVLLNLLPDSVIGKIYRGVQPQETTPDA